MAKKKAETKVKVLSRESIFADAQKELSGLAAKYKAQAISQSGGTAQRLNKASIDIARLSKLFV